VKRYALPTLLIVCALACAGMAPAVRAAGCPNEALSSGPSRQLPECRAYEMVSPVDKGDGSVYPIDVPRASASGEAVRFNSNSAFSGAPSAALGNSYVSRRGAGEWRTESVDAPQESREFQLTLPSPASSPDLSKTIELSRVALVPGAVEGGTNIYLRDNSTGERHLVVALKSATMFSTLTQAGSPPLVIGGTVDWSHILLSSRWALTSAAPEGVNNLYDYTGGRLHLVNYVPAGGGGEVIAGNASAVSTSASVNDSAIPYGHAMSMDGSRIFFTANGSVYMREDDARTVPISTSRLAGEEGALKRGERPVANSAGTVVYFLSFDALTAGTDCGLGSLCLYRYDVRTGEMQVLTPTGGASGPQIQAITGVDETGSSVYFTSPEALVSGAPAAVPGVTTNLYGYREGRLRFIAQTVEGDNESKGPKQSEVSPNGRYLAFAAFSSLAAEDVSSPSCPSSIYEPHREGDCRDVYLYDAQTEGLRCVSCDGPGRGDSSLGGQVEKRASNFDDEYPRAVLDDGTVFFDTPNRLVSRDLNAAMDVYGTREASARMFSTGTVESPSLFADATPDGRDVFFTTAQPLVRQDVDQNLDLYDARVEGGLASQWPPVAGQPCEGESCRGAAPAAPSGHSFGSGVSAGEACFAPDAGPALRRARQLRHRAARLVRHGGKSVARRARRLRHQALAQERLARRGSEGAARRARKLRREASAQRRLAHLSRKKAVRRARKLRRQAAAQRRLAKRQTTEANNCQEVGR
jgi:hypothetical protein